MTAISFCLLKVEENTEWAIYAFGDPPHRVLGHVKIFKADGQIKTLDVIKEKYRGIILSCVKKKLTENYQLGKYPDHEYYSA